jgi:hypothetical protein
MEEFKLDSLQGKPILIGRIENENKKLKKSQFTSSYMHKPEL